MSGGTHLELGERERLAALKAEGLSLRAIARALGRAASTVSRELRRNALPKGGYLPVHAEGCYRERRQRPAVPERDERLGRFVRERLLEGWTPEPIAGWLERGEERGLRPVSLETIYAFDHRPWQNDRVRRQACFQAVPVRSTALSVTTSSRMQAVSASLAGFPADAAARGRPRSAGWRPAPPRPRPCTGRPARSPCHPRPCACRASCRCRG